ncbi:MAG: hypothetical protein R3232_09830 [Clostridia bacterium]|nr:hypothetical protein [Clostridia bacterium]
MYSWNDLKISVEGDNKIFMDGIKKYINAVYVHDYEGECDVKATICNSFKTGIPSIPADARKVKSLVFNLNVEIRLDIYSYEKQIWFLYRDIAGVWIDYDTNEMIICISEMPLDFEYSNIQLFFLHPLGAILENLGFYRLHAGCVSIDGNSTLITGSSGSRKSLAAFSVPVHGGHIISDDITFLEKKDDGYHASSLSNLTRLHEGSITQYFPELNLLHEAAHYNEENYFFLEDINPSKPVSSVVKNIVLLNKSQKKKPSVKNVHSSEVFPQLFPTTIHTNIEEITGSKFVFISDLLNEITTYKMTLGDNITELYEMLEKLHDQSL